MALIAEVTDRIVAMWAAEVIAVGTPREIFADDEVMTRTKLYPPQITQFSRHYPLNNHNELTLTVGETVDALIGKRG